MIVFKQLGILREKFRIVFKNNKYLSDIDQGYVAMIRRVQAVVGAEQKEYQKGVEISMFLELDFGVYSPLIAQQ